MFLAVVVIAGTMARGAVVVCVGENLCLAVVAAARLIKAHAATLAAKQQEDE